MFALQLELLGGRWAAAAYNDRTRVEWPPHPARLYSALVATWAETEGDEAEAAALDALATLPPPQLQAPPIRGERVSGVVYVPVNDTAAARNYDANWQKLNEAWLERVAAQAALASAKGEKEAKRQKKIIDKADKTIAKLRETVAGFLASGEAPDKVLGLFPDQRAKQPRSFPSVTPDSPLIDFLWPEGAATMAPHLEALDALLARVHRVGLSHTLVTLRRTDAPGPANWQPHEEGDTILRWVEPGQRSALERYHALHQGVEPRVMPARPIPYGNVEELRATRTAPRSALAGDFIVYERCGGPPIPLQEAVRASQILHRALVRFAPQQPDGNVHPAVSGRDPDGSPTSQSHTAILPLPFIGSPWADGSVLGFAVVLPATLSEQGRLATLQALGAWEQHWRDSQASALAARGAGDVGAMLLGGFDDERRIDLFHDGEAIELRRVIGRSQRSTLREPTWTRPARDWATVTPIALDRHPKKLWDRDAKAAARGEERAIETIARACENVGLPRPSRIRIDRDPPLIGGEPVRRFPSFPEGGRGPRRVLVHARLHFDAPVRGPVVLGAGRFLGLGLLRPLPSQQIPRPEEDSE